MFNNVSRLIQNNIAFGTAYGVHVLLVVTATAWFASGWGSQNNYLVAWISFGTLALVLVPFRPLWGIYAYIGVVYSFPRYTGEVDYIYRHFVPEVIALLSAFGLFIWLARSGIGSDSRASRFYWVMFGLVGWSMLSTFYVLLQSENWFALREYFDLKHHPARYTNALFLFVVAASSVKDRRDFQVFALIAAAVLTVKWMTFGTVIVARPGAFAELVVMVLPLCVAAAITSSNLLQRFVLTAASVNLLWILYSTQNRGAGLAFVAILIVLWLQSSIKLKILAIAVPCLIASGFALHSSPYWQRFATIPQNLIDGRDASISERLTLWKAVPKVVRDHAVLGVGPGRSPSYLSQYTGPDINSAYAVHNNFFAILIELGFVGLILYVSLFAGMLIALWRFGQGFSPNLPIMEARFLVASIVAYLVAGMFITRHDQALPYILVGMGIALLRQVSPENKTSS
jgi:hypothetical protein